MSWYIHDHKKHWNTHLKMERSHVAAVHGGITILAGKASLSRSFLKSRCQVCHSHLYRISVSPLQFTLVRALVTKCNCEESVQYVSQGWKKEGRGGWKTESGRSGTPKVMGSREHLWPQKNCWSINTHHSAQTSVRLWEVLGINGPGFPGYRSTGRANSSPAVEQAKKARGSKAGYRKMCCCSTCISQWCIFL